MLEQQPDLEALVLSVGGGSHVVGAITVAREIKPPEVLRRSSDGCACRSRLVALGQDDHLGEGGDVCRWYSRPEGAGAVGPAGLCQLRSELAGNRVGCADR